MRLALLLLSAAQFDFTALYREALEERIRDLGPEHPKVARSAADLGLYLANRGDRAG
ncbi:MAG: hypothetical protein HYZ57_08945, partial [Acidobacteria bacterium]|nr:hypothetical protein [Acidobacteriota bacterium]